MTPSPRVIPLLVASLLGACSPSAPPRSSLPVLADADCDPAAGYERPPVVRANEILPEEVLRGPHHRVREAVATDGLLHLYTVESDLGDFEAAGDLALRLRVQEIRAVFALRTLRQSAEYETAHRAAVADPFVSRWKLVTDPVDSVEGVPNPAWQEVMRIADLRPAERSLAEVAVRREVRAFESAKRQLARRLAVNPYSTNPALQTELNRDAWVISAGGLELERVPSLVEASVAPLPQDALPAERLAQIFQHESPEDLRRRNRIELAVMGLPKPQIDAFLSHPLYSPRQQTGVVESLVALEPAAQRGAYVEAALRAETPADPVFFLMGALMLRLYHEEVAPVEQLLVIGDHTAAAYTGNHGLVVCAQADYLLWTRPAERFVRTLADAAPPGLDVRSRELWLSGRVSPRARREMEALGIRVVEGVFERLFQRLGSRPAAAASP